METNKFTDLVSTAGEHFDDYLIMARKGSTLHFRASDDTWGLGAVQRYLNHMANEDKIAFIKSINREDE